MPKKHFQPEEIIGKLRHADVLLGQGKMPAEVVKALGTVTSGLHDIDKNLVSMMMEGAGHGGVSIQTLRHLLAGLIGLQQPSSS